MKKMHIKIGDTVKVTAGKDRGKEGKVLHILRKKDRAVVEGVQKHLKHQKANAQTGDAGQILEREGSIHVSNLQVICPSCEKTTRIAKKIENNKSVRSCKKCAAELG